MPTPRKPTSSTTEAIDQFCAHFDDLLPRYEERTALRQYLIGLLLPREHNKTLVELGAIVPGADRQRLHHFLHDAPGKPRRSIAVGWRSGRQTPISAPMPRAYSSWPSQTFPRTAAASSAASS